MFIFIALAIEALKKMQPMARLKESIYYLTGHQIWKELPGPLPLFFPPILPYNFNFKCKSNFTGRVKTVTTNNDFNH